jgi:ankyrin repeat protein
VKCRDSGQETAIVIAEKEETGNSIISLGLSSPLSILYAAEDSIIRAIRTGNANAFNKLLKTSRKTLSDPHILLSALLVAARRGYTDIVRLILDRGFVSVNDCDEDGFSALMAAALGCCSETCAYLLNRGARIEVESSTKRTAFICAVRARSVETLMSLMSPVYNATGNDILNRRDLEGRTALYWASKESKFGDIDSPFPIVKLLINGGSDVDIRTHDGLTALQEARRRADPGLIDLLLKSGATDSSLMSSREIALEDNETIPLSSRPIYESKALSKVKTSRKDLWGLIALAATLGVELMQNLTLETSYRVNRKKQ